MRTLLVNIISLIVLFASTGKAEIVNFRADSVRYKMATPKQVTCIGNAVISNTNNLMKADKIVISGMDLDEAKLFGKVQVAHFKSETLLTSDYIEYFQKKDYIRALTNPVLTMGRLVIRTEVMERFLDREISLIQGFSAISRSNILVNCRSGIYDEKRGRVDLRGEPKIQVRHTGTSDLFDDFSCGQITLFNTNNTVILSRGVKGRIHLNE